MNTWDDVCVHDMSWNMWWLDGCEFKP